MLQPDGKPAAGMKLWLMKLPDADQGDDDDTCCAVVSEFTSDGEGRFSFQVMVSYTLEPSDPDMRGVAVFMIQ